MSNYEYTFHSEQMRCLVDNYAQENPESCAQYDEVDKKVDDKRARDLSKKVAERTMMLAGSSVRDHVVSTLTDILVGAGNEMVNEVMYSTLSADAPVETEHKGNVAVKTSILEKDPDPAIGGGLVIGRFVLWYDGQLIRLSEERGRKLAGWKDSKKPSLISKDAAKVMIKSVGLV